MLRVQGGARAGRAVTFKPTGSIAVMEAELKLEAAVRALRPVERANLRYHMAIGTRVLVGPAAVMWVDDEGCCCVAWMAGTRQVPSGPVFTSHKTIDLPPDVVTAYRIMSDVVQCWLPLVMADLTEAEARAAITRGLASGW